MTRNTAVEGLVELGPGGTMQKAHYQAIVYRQAEGPWVAEVPALSGCYALMPTKEAALEELRRILREKAAEYQGTGKELPSDTTQVVRV